PQVRAGRLLPGLLLAAMAAAGAGFATSRNASRSPAARLALLTLVAALLLRALPAFEHYGAEKHAAALASEINTSYFQVARGIHDPDAYVRGYAARMAAYPIHPRRPPPECPPPFPPRFP